MFYNINYKRFIHIIFFKIIPFLLSAQSEKLSPNIKNSQLRHAFTATKYLISTTNIDSFNHFIKKKLPDVQIEYVYKPADVLILNIKKEHDFDKVVKSPYVLFVDYADRKPREELKVPGHNLATNRITTIQNLYPQLRGDDMTISIKENRFDSNDIDLKNRYRRNPKSAKDLTSHANIMATLIGGAGNSSYQGRGAAIGAQMMSHSFDILLPEDDAEYSTQNISIQNHSYGVGIENFYGADAVAYDKSVELNPALLHVFSAGNRGLQASNSGFYAGITGFANITGSFKMSKNTLSIGAVDSFGRAINISSHGPAYDGRIKPELSAYASDGSSEAAALVSGTAAILQQRYALNNNRQRPSSALVRAILVNTADDIGQKGVDFTTGFGNLNALKAVELMQNARFFNKNIKKNENWQTDISIPENVKELKITLAWNDPPSVVNAPKALVNDLDLSLTHKTSETSWQPWILNIVPHADSLKQPAARGRDTLNNTEHISVENPQAGVYTINILGMGLKTDSQDFSIAYDFIIKNNLHFTYPLSKDPVLSGAENIVRWENSFDKPTGRLSFKPINSTQWRVLTDTLNMQQGWWRWLTPDTFTQAQLRIDIDNQSFISDTFVISKPLRINVAFNCPDSVGIYWQKTPTTEGYRIDVLGEKYLTTLTTTGDTFIVFKKNILPSTHIAIAPILPPLSKNGIFSLAANYETQGTGCYFKSFLVELKTEEAVDLTLTLGTLYGIKAIFFEKYGDKSFNIFKTIQNPADLNFKEIDMNLKTGINKYRIRLELVQGGFVLSDIIDIYIFKNQDYFVFPNPVSGNGILSVLSNDLEESSFKIYNAMGALVFEKILTAARNDYILPSLSNGIYIYTIGKNKTRVFNGKLFIKN